MFIYQPERYLWKFLIVKKKIRIFIIEISWDFIYSYLIYIKNTCDFILMEKLIDTSIWCYFLNVMHYPRLFYQNNDKSSVITKPNNFCFNSVFPYFQLENKKWFENLSNLLRLFLLCYTVTKKCYYDSHAGSQRTILCKNIGIFFTFITLIQIILFKHSLDIHIIKDNNKENA